MRETSLTKVTCEEQKTHSASIASSELDELKDQTTAVEMNLPQKNLTNHDNADE